MSRHRLRPPESVHARFVAGEFGAIDVRDVERQQNEAAVFGDTRVPGVLTGDWASGEGGANLARLLHERGEIDDQTVRGDIPQLSGKGPVPTFSALVDAGTGAVTTGSDGTDRSGILVIIGGTGAVVGSIGRIGFAQPRGSASFGVQFTPGSSFAAGLGPVWYTGRSASKVDLATSAVLANGVTYSWTYTVEDLD